jgi:hypothetical protein
MTSLSMIAQPSLVEGSAVPTIQIELEVNRFEEFPEDGMVQIWGYVGDYEVSVWLPLDDERVRLLREKASSER